AALPVTAVRTARTDEISVPAMFPATAAGAPGHSAAASAVPGRSGGVARDRGTHRADRRKIRPGNVFSAIAAGAPGHSAAASPVPGRSGGVARDRGTHRADRRNI
ncbi:hypothetical protein OY671_013161, partial [Metschnikowia pulcherrima]